MRISGGVAKGRSVLLRRSFAKRHDGDELRPTSAKVRKAVFDILGPRVVGCRFLDLYAGTGAVGFEALSRGAGIVVFVDDSPARTRVIAELIDRYGFSGHALVITDEAVRFVTSPGSAATGHRAAHPFDVLFLDPPYYSDEVDTILALPDTARLLAPGGVLIVEHPSRRRLPDAPGGLRSARRYRYGDTSLILYVRDAGHGEGAGRSLSARGEEQR
jgi:16S rRNA (guanine(966)-N(2))-methyltransferase RsmD